MKKSLGLLSAALLASALATSHAAESPFTSEPHPTDLTDPLHLPASKPILAPKLDLRTSRLPGSDFFVGKDNVLLFKQSRDFHTRPDFDHRDEWILIAKQVNGPDTLERLGKLLDFEDTERPWSTTTTVHLLAPTNSWLKPFAAVAHEVDVNEDLTRTGIGAGAMITFSKHAFLTAEIIHFAGERTPTNSSFTTETQFLTRLQIEF